MGWVSGWWVWICDDDGGMGWVCDDVMVVWGGYVTMGHLLWNMHVLS